MSLLDPNLSAIRADRGRLELAAPRPGDPWLIASNSGINGSVVELARLVREAGHPVVAGCSFAHSWLVPSRHPSGLRLPDLADVGIDTRARRATPPCNCPTAPRSAPLSKLVGFVIVRRLTEDIARRMLAAVVTPPAHPSMNVPDQANPAQPAAYGNRIRPIEPLSGRGEFPPGVTGENST